MGSIIARASFGEWFGDRGLKILVILGVAIVVTVGSRIAVGRFSKRLRGTEGATQPLNIQRVTTLTEALSAGAVVVIWVVAALMVLGELDVDLGPLLASAGVAGVALGFGAQSVVRDTLSGFFILLENQFGVGDILELQTTESRVTGRVESLSLRITSLRAFDGTLHMVPNGNIVVASNRSRGWARAIVDVRAAYDEDVEQLREVLGELFDEIRSDASTEGWIYEGPTVLGVETLGTDALVVRVIAETKPSKRLEIERILRERISGRLAQKGVRVPVTAATPPPPPSPR